MVFLLCELGGARDWDGAGGVRRAGQDVEHGAVLGLESPAFGVGESHGGDLEGAEVEQGLLGPTERLFEPGAQRPDGGAGLRLGSDHAEGSREQRRALERLLLVLRQPAQRVGQRRPQLSAVDLALERRRQTLGEQEPVRHPTLPAPGSARHGNVAQLVIVDERVDGARLVHDREASRGSIRAQQEQLLIHRGRGLLDQHRQLAVSGTHPVREPLEAVQDLERAVVSWGHAQGHLGQQGCALSRWRRAPAQRGQVGAQALHVDPADLRKAAAFGCGAHDRLR
ncbi:MAG: hypothetical protein MUF10_20040 [Thermoanaerobaculaceae bacterium]|nr:hypothetical protein [Thermoanaerobaculaceae bacterium]